MYDYNVVLELLGKSDVLKEEIKSSILRLCQEDSGKDNTQALLAAVSQHFYQYHPSPLILETGLDGRMTYVNDEFARLAGYTVEEMIGQNVNILRSSRMEAGLFTDLWNHLSEGKMWRGEIQNRTNQLSTYWIDTLICPVFDAEGQPYKYWSLSFDITDLRIQQEKTEQTSKEVEESLRYAKRIQKTILPSKKDMDEVLDDYFVLYKPKDIVSGDFYWFVKTINKAFIAVVDCTGHGVPGAFMSLIGFNLLNQIVLKEHISHPGQILSELHNQIRHTLRQDQGDGQTKDGMDVCLLVLDRYGEGVEYAGAFRPLYWWNGTELVIIEGDKMSIGGEQLEEERVFTNHEFEVESGHIVYMFSDGLTDQFGGPDQKKFSTKRLRNIITENIEEPMSIQKAVFNIAWKDWKADDPQTDDVTLVAIKF
jgi:PAS domain S-box-containing protein